MTRLVVLFLVSLLSLSSWPTWADSKPVILPNGPFKVNLIGSAQWLEADHTSLSLGQLQLEHSPEFTTLQSNPILKPKKVYWLRLKLLNPLNHSIPAALTLGQSAFQVQSAYSFRESHWQRLPGYERAFKLNANRAIQILVPPQSHQWLYIRLSSAQTIDMSPVLSNQAQYTQSIMIQEQWLGGMIALMVFLIIMHSLAARFHNHIRHYLAIYLASVGLLHGVAQLPLGDWPNWMDNLIKLIPWGLAIGILLSSFSTEAYRAWLRSTRVIILLMVLLLISLLLFNLSNEVVWCLALLPTAYAFYRTMGSSITLSTAGLTLLLYTAWLLFYAFWPESVPYYEKSIELATPAFVIFMASLSMLLTYFRRQQVLNKPSAVQSTGAEFLSKLSHELRTPINGVLGMSELMNDTPLTTTQRDYVETIQVSGNEILLMVNRISEYAKISTGRFQLDQDTVELSSAVYNSLSKFQQTAHQKRIELVINLADDLPARIRSDEHRLVSVLDNLVENAIRHTEHGEVEVRVQWQDPTEQAMLMFQVRDTGAGIHRDDLHRIFDSFDMLTPQKSQQFNGTGLGLSLSKRIVELMGGKIYADSTAGSGSCFTFLVPFTAVANIPEEDQAGEELSGLSILIVDDNATLRKVMQRYAKSWGMQADATYSGKEALAMLRTKANLNTPYDIILIDQDMPIMNGFQLADRIQEDEQINTNLLKVMLTGLGISSTNKQAQLSGIDHVITKPVGAKALQQALSKYIQAKHRKTRKTAV